MREVSEVDIVGLTADHCVRATALDAVRDGFAASVLLDLTAGVLPDTTAAALEEMRAAGITLVGSQSRRDGVAPAVSRHNGDIAARGLIFSSRRDTPPDPASCR